MRLSLGFGLAVGILVAMTSSIGALENTAAEVADVEIPRLSQLDRLLGVPLEVVDHHLSVALVRGDHR